MFEALVERDGNDLLRAGSFGNNRAEQGRAPHCYPVLAPVDYDVNSAVKGLCGSWCLDGVTGRDRLGVQSDPLGSEQVDLGVAALETPSGDSDDLKSIDVKADAMSRIAWHPNTRTSTT